MAGGLDAEFSRLRVLGKQLAEKLADSYIPIEFKEKLGMCGQLLAGLQHVHAVHMIHGDIKPENVFLGKKHAELSDFGGALLIPNLIQTMQPRFKMRNEEEKNRLKIVVDAFRSNDANRMQTASTSNPEALQKLIEWEAVSVQTSGCFWKKSQVMHAVPRVLNDLFTYLQVSFLPTKSVGYACPQYTKVMCDYFWRCEPVNFERACNAFDQRALGITMYVFLAIAEIPYKDTDTPEYYEKMELALKSKGVPERACMLIRKMSQPIEAFDTSSGNQFPLPLQPDECQELGRLLTDAAK